MKKSLRLCTQFDLLDGNNFIGGHVYGLVDNTVRALSEDGYNLNLLFVNEADWLEHGLVHKR